eukprot:6358533-Lingulodinium_polyedra.AAC.1
MGILSVPLKLPPQFSDGRVSVGGGPERFHRRYIRFQVGRGFSVEFALDRAIHGARKPRTDAGCTSARDVCRFAGPGGCSRAVCGGLLRPAQATQARRGGAQGRVGGAVRRQGPGCSWATRCVGLGQPSLAGRSMTRAGVVAVGRVVRGRPHPQICSGARGRIAAS